MNSKTSAESFAFETEVSQLLNLMIHSLYSEKEVFLRELVSNAADACDKLHFLSLTDPKVLTKGAHPDDSPLASEPGISIRVDKEANTLVIEDNGVGMTREEVVSNLGTIARSGTKQFVESLQQTKSDASTEDDPLNLIGQFGVGFYSAFMVAKEVRVDTLSATDTDGEAVAWVSDGTGEYQLLSSDRTERGTAITLTLREDASEFADPTRIRHVIGKYSDHIALPIHLKADDEDSEKINEGQALWTRARNEISEEDYHGFYQSLTFDHQAPLSVLHNRVEGNLEYTSLLFIPAKAPFDLWDRDRKHGIKLYVRRVFITEDAQTVMPAYLRFVRGLIDAEDLPLNVSREFLQNNRDIDRIRNAIVKKILAELKRMADDDAENYATFWQEFGRAFKEGIVEDHSNQQQIASLLRFATSTQTSDDQTVSLETYLERKSADQDAIYYITADTAGAARRSPHLEVFSKNNIEVLLLSDPVDEWVVSNLTEFNEVPLKSVTKGELDASLTTDDKDLSEKTESMAPLLEKFKEVLGEDVKEVRLTGRLTDSPACLVSDDEDLGANLARILKAAGQDAPEMKPILEINPDHPMVKAIDPTAGNAQDWVRVLFDQAALSEGASLGQPADYVQRVNSLLTQLAMRG